MEEKNNVVIYQSEDGKTKIDVKLEGKQYGYLNNKWQNYLIHQDQILSNI